ncbi:caspase family protein [Streptomyces sp. NPDC001902]
MRLPDPDRSRALLLGTSTFADPELPNLAAVRNNIEDLATVLTSRWGTGLAPEACIRMPDEPDLAVIGSRLLAASAAAEDMLLVYYSGHGLVGPDGQLHLSLPGTHSDRALVAWTGLPFALLRGTLATARAANRVLVLDCCFSGRAIDMMADTASLVAGQIEVTGTCTLTSSPANRSAVAPVGARHTAYTGELLRLLRHGTGDETEFLTLPVIHEHLSALLPRKGFPVPEQRNTRTIGRLALARNRPPAGTADAIALAEEGRRLEALGDITRALSCYRSAAIAGQRDAMVRLALLLRQSGDTFQASLWHRKAAEAGHPTAMYELGLQQWQTGDPTQAEQWLQKAADAGVSEARDSFNVLRQLLSGD